MKKNLTQETLVATAKEFCKQKHVYAELFGITDGKAVGTFVEQKIQQHIASLYDTTPGNAASGLDLPAVETDIKVTSIRQPQSSCPYRSARQKIYGLGYNLLLFVYEKKDDHKNKVAILTFVHCALIDKSRTADYQLTRSIAEILARNGTQEDIFALLNDRGLPGDDVVHTELASEIIQSPPALGYLTISNALQWRLQYGRVVALKENVSGIVKIV